MNPTAIQNYMLNVTADEANLIGAALGKLPFETVAELIAKIRTQAQMQERAAMVDGAPQPNGVAGDTSTPPPPVVQ